MGKKDKNKKKGHGAEKTALKTDKKLAAKQKRLLEKIGEVNIIIYCICDKKPSRFFFNFRLT